MGLPTNENHLNFLWLEYDCKVLFSVTRCGDAVNCHLASDQEGKKKIKKAINEFFEFIKDNFRWCKMVLTIIENKKIIEWVKDCGFNFVCKRGKHNLFVREI